MTGIERIPVQSVGQGAAPDSHRHGVGAIRRRVGAKRYGIDDRGVGGDNSSRSTDVISDCSPAIPDPITIVSHDPFTSSSRASGATSMSIHSERQRLSKEFVIEGQCRQPHRLSVH
jgi:hypothetical protein